MKLHVDTNSRKFKVEKVLLGGHGQKWVWSIWSWDSKIIDHILRMNG